MAIFSEYDQDKKISINDAATSPMNLEIREKNAKNANMSYNF